jgi:hypothetical protein
MFSPSTATTRKEQGMLIRRQDETDSGELICYETGLRN